MIFKEVEVLKNFLVFLGPTSMFFCKKYRKEGNFHQEMSLTSIGLFHYNISYVSFILDSAVLLWTLFVSRVLFSNIVQYTGMFKQ